MAGKPEQPISHPAPPSRVVYHHQKIQHHHQSIQQQQQNVREHRQNNKQTAGLSRNRGTYVYGPSERLVGAVSVIGSNDNAEVAAFGEQSSVGGQQPQVGGAPPASYHLDGIGKVATRRILLPATSSRDAEDPLGEERRREKRRRGALMSRIDDEGTRVSSVDEIDENRRVRENEGVPTDEDDEDEDDEDEDEDGDDDDEDEDPTSTGLTSNRIGNSRLAGNAGVAPSHREDSENDPDPRIRRVIGLCASVTRPQAPNSCLGYSEAMPHARNCPIGVDIGINARSSSSSSSNSSPAFAPTNGAIFPIDGYARATYSRRNQTSKSNRARLEDDLILAGQHHRQLAAEIATRSQQIARCHSASLDIVESSCISNSSNSSNCSEEPSGRSSSASILDNECQVALSGDPVIGASVFGGQAPPPPSVNQPIAHRNNVTCLLVNESADATQRQNQIRSYPVQKVTTISEPRGWKRISTNNVIIYISPSSTALGSLSQLKEYLTTPGTCKCGLECPFRPERVFNFDPKVATRPWSPERGKRREMNKLCNHKRKLLSTTGAASPVASSTPNLSVSSCEPAAPVSSILAGSPSPNSTDPTEHTRKDGLSKKKKRKLAVVGNIYPGVSNSQLAIQAIDPSSTDSGQPMMIAKNPQMWQAGNVAQIDRPNRDSSHCPMEACNPVNMDSNVCGVINSQQRFQHNMSGMMMAGNPLIINQRPDHRVNNLPQESFQNQQMQIICQPNPIANQMSQHYQNQMEPQHKIRIHESDPTKQCNAVANSNKHYLHHPELRQDQRQHVIGQDGRFQMDQDQIYDPQYSNQNLDDRNEMHRVTDSGMETEENEPIRRDISEQSPMMNHIPMQCRQIVQNGLCQNQVQTTYSPEMVIGARQGKPDRKIPQQPDNFGQTRSDARCVETSQSEIAPGWQMRTNAGNVSYKNQTGNLSDSCNNFDRVPPLHHHIPQVFAWTEELAKKKPKSTKATNKKQRQHHNIGETRHMGVEPSSSSEKFEDLQNRDQISSIATGNGPSFLEDPSGYLAQQTALLNSTISRQTGVGSSRINNFTSVTLDNPGENICNDNSGMYGQQSRASSLCDSVKNHATSPVLVHSSSVPSNSDNSLSFYNQTVGTDKPDTRSCYIQDQYADDAYRTDQSEDPVTSSTFAERFSFNERQVDPRPIQGGTVSTSYGSPAGSSSSSLANSESPPSSNSTLSQPATPRNSSEPSTPQSNYSLPATPYSCSTSAISLPVPLLEPPSPGFHHAPAGFASWNNKNGHQDQNLPSRYPTTTTVSSSVSPSPSPSLPSSQSQIPLSTVENVPSHLPVRSNAHPSQNALDLYQRQQHLSSRDPVIQRGSVTSSTIVTTMASGHTYSSNTITSVLAGRTNTATVSINAPSSALSNPAISNIPGHGKRQRQPANINYAVLPTSSNVGNAIPSNSHNASVSKSPLEMVQSVVSSIQVPKTSSAQIPQGQQLQSQNQQQQSNIQVHNVLATSAGGILKQTNPAAAAAAAVAAASLPPGHILVSSGGQLIMASTGGSNIGGVMPPPQNPTKMLQNGNAMPPLSVSPMVTNVSAGVNQVIPPVGVAQQMIGQPTVLVNTIQAPVLIQPGVVTMDGIGQNVQIPHIAMTTGNVLQNAQTILDANQEANNRGQNIISRQSPAESTVNKKKVYKKRKNNSQTIASMLQIASSQQNSTTGMLLQSQSNFAQQNFQSPNLGGPMLQALTIVPGKGGAPAQLVMNGQASGAAQATQFNTQQIITNSQPSQQINLLQPVNLLNGATGMMQNFPTIQQFIVPGLGSMVMSTDGTATLLQDTGNLGMQLQIQNVNGQNVLTPVQSSAGIFGPGQGILATGPAGMVIRAPQASGGKIIQQHGAGAQFLSPNGGQFLMNGSTSFGNQLSPIVASVNPSQQITFNASQVRPSQALQAQQEFIQMNGQTLMVPCATSQNIAVSSAANQQNTTFVQQNTTIVQQQTTMVSNSQISGFQTASPVNNGNNRVERSAIDLNQSYIVNPTIMSKGKNLGQVESELHHQQQQQKHQQKSLNNHNNSHNNSANHVNGNINSNSNNNNRQDQSNENVGRQQQNVLSSTSSKNVRVAAGPVTSGKNQSESIEEQYNQSMVRHSVSTQTALAAAAAGNQSNKLLGQGGSPPDTTTHSPGNSQRSNSPAVDTTTHGAASPAPQLTSHRHSSSTPMVHCITSSEPDSADLQAMSDDWRLQQMTMKEMITPNQLERRQQQQQQLQQQQQQQHFQQMQPQQQLDGQTYVESTVSTGIQIYASETSEQTEGVMSTVRCESRGIKRKLASVHDIHPILHEDQDVSGMDDEEEEEEEDDEDDDGEEDNVGDEVGCKNWKLEVGQLVWGSALGSSAWPGKVETVGPPGSLTVGVRWYGAGAASGLTNVQIKSLKSLSDGLEAHHRARKKVRKSRKLNMQLENAIQEAMTELDRYSDAKPRSGRRRSVPGGKSRKRKPNPRINGKAAAISSTGNSLRNREMALEAPTRRGSTKQLAPTTDSSPAARAFKKQCR